ncbi:hypothetical protein LG204_06120 [Methylovorus menthalis]|uniref:hypothetical protein n=1 Tax=Methylovorus menthalis TaxID=1002227 RepID=UPI001E5C8202|nr:hypothetical protein [Methylovorus menthalis]MCB4810887.1 hypothetical protein [Methylovorus menthalis]
MGVLLILPILVSGFIFCHSHPYYYLKLHRYEGQYLYLQAAKLGIDSLIAALGLHWALQAALRKLSSTCSFIPSFDYISWIAGLLASLDSSHQILNDQTAYQAAWLIVLSATMILVIPYIYSWLYEFILRKKHGFTDSNQIRLFIMAELFKDSPLDKLLFDSMRNQEQSLMLTMEDRKVYIGRVISMGEPNENEGADQEIAFMPISSGYRNKDDLTVTLITEYSKISQDFLLVLKQEKIVSATPFDFDVFEKLGDDKPKRNRIVSFLKQIYAKKGA